MLALLLATAVAGASPFVLPPGEATSAWTAPLAMAGFEPAAAADGVGVVVTADGATWTLHAHGVDGVDRVATVASPGSPADRERIAWLGASLVEPVTSAPVAPVSAVAPAPASPPQPVAPRPHRRAPADDLLPRAPVEATPSPAPAASAAPRVPPPMPPDLDASTPPPTQPGPWRVAVSLDVGRGRAPSPSAAVGIETSAGPLVAGGAVRASPASPILKAPGAREGGVGLRASAGLPFAAVVAGLDARMFGEDGRLVGVRAMPVAGARGGLVVGEVGGVPLWLEGTVERDLVPVRVYVGDEDDGRLSPWAFDVAIAAAPRRE